MPGGGAGARGAPPDEQQGRSRTGLRAVQWGLAGLIVVSLPAAGVAVFSFDADRDAAGDSVSVVFFGALVLLLSTPWWPLGANEGRSRFERAQSMVLVWFGVTFTTHVTWELAWLLFHEQIQSAPDAVWSYPWWAYIDGGDARYATDDPLLLTLEVLSVINGLIGWTALWRWHTSRGRSRIAVLALMATAVVHLYSASVYFGTEIFGGYPNVETTSPVDFYLKFFALNGLWLVMPWVVLWWGYRVLTGDADGSAGKAGGPT